MKKIIKKLVFGFKIISLGGDAYSKIVLFKEFVRIQKHFYFGGEKKSFQCKIKNNGKAAEVIFQGTLDEMHALMEIFIERCYDPKIRNTKTALDFGANIGLASIWIWTEFPDCKIHAYEPNPVVFKMMQENLKIIPEIKTFNIAITDKNDVIDFHVSERSFSSSIYSKTKSDKVFKIRTKTIDSAIYDLGNEIDLMKIDIEGAEFPAIESSKNLNLVNVIVGEMHPEKAAQKIQGFVDKISETHGFILESEGKSLFYARRI